MNIQQLNGSGQNLWAFFMTAVTALLVTGGSWLFSNRLSTQRSKALVWYKERAPAKRTENERGEKREYGLPIRVAMLVWLVRNGFTTWMLKSGAGIAILINSNVLVHEDGVRANETACDYVSDRSRPGRAHGYHLGDSRYSRQLTWSPLSE